MALIGDFIIILVVAILVVTAYHNWFAKEPIVVGGTQYCEVGRVSPEASSVDLTSTKKVTDFWTVATEDGYIILAPCE